MHFQLTYISLKSTWDVSLSGLLSFYYANFKVWSAPRPSTVLRRSKTIWNRSATSEKYIANVCQISPKVSWPRLHSRKHQHRMNSNIGFIVCIVLPFTDMCMQKDYSGMLMKAPLSITLQALKMCSKKVHGAKSKEIQKQKVVFQNLSKSVLCGRGCRTSQTLNLKQQVRSRGFLSCHITVGPTFFFLKKNSLGLRGSGPLNH